MKRSDSILLNFYRGKLPKYQQRPGTVDLGYKPKGTLGTGNPITNVMGVRNVGDMQRLNQYQQMIQEQQRTAKMPILVRPDQINYGDFLTNNNLLSREELQRQAEIRKQMTINEMLAKQGTIGPAQPRQSWYSKAWEVATNPTTAFAYAARNERIPDNFSKGDTRTAGLNALINTINPLVYVQSGINALGSQANALKYLSQGDLGKAASSYGDFAVNAFGALPLAGPELNLANRLGSLGKRTQNFVKGFGKTPTNFSLNDYRNIEQLRLAAGKGKYDPRFSAFESPEHFAAVKSDANQLLQKYRKEFKQKFGSGSDTDMLIYAGAQESKNLPASLVSLADDPIAISQGLNQNITPYQKFLGDTYQLEFSQYFNRPRTAFQQFLSDELQDVIKTNKLNSIMQVSRGDDFNRMVRTLRNNEWKNLHFDELNVGDIIEPGTNWSTSANITGNMWGPRKALVNLNPGQSVFRPNMFEKSIYPKEEEILLPRALRYKVSGIDRSATGYKDPSYIFDVINTYKQGGRLPRYQNGNQVKLVTTDKKTYNLTPKDPLYHWFYGQRASSPGQSYIKTKNPDGSWNLSVSSSDIPSEYLEPYYSKVATGEPAIINVIPERKRAAQAREAVISGNEDAEFAFPDGSIKKWKDMSWREQQYVAGKNMGSWTNNNWTDFINPIAMIGSMGEGLATAPYMAKRTDSYLPYILGVGAPLLTGALAGIGAKGTGQFIENVVSPIPARLSDVGQFLTEKTPLQYAYKLNPRAFTANPNMLYRGIGEEGLADVLEAGYFRGKQNVPRVNFPGTNLNASKSFGNTTYWSPRFETAAQYGQGVIAEVPKDVTKFLQKYRKSDWSQFTTNKIPLDQATILRKHWWKGYKPINIPGGRSINLNAASVKPSIIPQEITAENIGNIVDLDKDITGGVGNFNFGIYPTKDNPNVLLKLDDIAGLGDKTIWGKIDDNEIAKARASWKTGLPETMKNINDPNVSRMLAEYYISGLSKTGIHPRLRGLNARTPNLDIPVAGRLITRVEGKPMIYGDFDLEELANLPPSIWQDVLDRLRMLHSNKLGVDMHGDNILLSTGVNKPSLSLVDLAGTKQILKPGKLDLSGMYGFSQGAKGVDVRNIQGNLWDRINRAVNNASQRAGEGAYSTEEISDILDRLKNDIYKIKKQGGPVVNPRGYMDGQPPKGSNWRIPGDGMGTSITMDLPNMPDEILVVPDGDFDQAKVMKRGDEEYFAGADFVDEYTMKGGGLTPNKAREILHDGTVHGRPLTEKQRRYFGAMSKGHTKEYQIGGLTDDQKRELAKRIVTIAKQREAKGKWVDVPESIKNSPAGQEEGVASCIGGVCSVLEEAGAIPSVIWSNTEFSRLAPKLGFPNRGWGLKGIENLEPGDIVQYMDPTDKNPNKAVPHHAQIFMGINSDGQYEFWDNFNKSIRAYPKERLENDLAWNKKPDESQMQIYKINPYNKSAGYNPNAQKAIEDRAANVAYQTQIYNLPDYQYSLREDSPLRNNTPTGVKKFLDKANNYDWISDVVKKVDKAGYGNRATREQVHDALLNVFGILGQENKWENPWVGGDIAPSWMPQIPLESTIERAASPRSMSIGPGQIKYSELSKPIKKAFDIKRRQDLQDWDKVIPLMVGMDIANKQWMENQGERFSERIIGDPGLTSQQMKWDEGRLSPYFYRGPGVSDVRDYVRSLADDTWYDAVLPKYVRSLREMEMDPAERDQYVKENIRKYQKVFDKGSYGRKVWENWANNLERKMINPADSPENAIELRDLLLPNVPRPRRQLGGNALAMLRDYGGGISVPRLNSPLPKAQLGLPIKSTTPIISPILNLIDFFAGDKEDVAAKPKAPEVALEEYFNIVDPRKVRATTGQPINPNVDLVAGQYPSSYIAQELKLAKQKGLSKEDAWNLAAIAFQESGWGKTDRNLGHVIGPVGKGNYGSTLINAYMNKMAEADRLGVTDPYTRLQVYNGLGKIFPSTEQKYHGFKMKKIYGVPVPQGGLSLRDNPLYGKQVVDIRENVLKKNPEVVQYVESLYKKDGGGFGVFGYVGDGWYKNGGQHGGLDRWFAEKWVDIKSGKPCGRQEGESRAYPACRPSKRVSSKTPKTSGEMSSSEKAKFKSSKTSSQRIPYNHKRR